MQRILTIPELYERDLRLTESFGSEFSIALAPDFVTFNTQTQYMLHPMYSPPEVRARDARINSQDAFRVFVDLDNTVYASDAAWAAAYTIHHPRHMMKALPSTTHIDTWMAWQKICPICFEAVINNVQIYRSMHLRRGVKAALSYLRGYSAISLIAVSARNFAGSDMVSASDLYAKGILKYFDSVKTGIADKATYAQACSANLVIDDAPHTLVECEALGIPTIKMAYPYNKDVPTTYTATSWRQVANQVSLAYTMHNILGPVAPPTGSLLNLLRPSPDLLRSALPGPVPF